MVVVIAKFLSFQYASSYIFSTVPIGSVSPHLISTLRHVAISIIELTNALVELIFLSSVILFKLLILAFPHALNLLKIIYDFHRTQLTPRDMIVEFVIVSVILTCVLFRKRIRLYWKKLEANISAKSRAAAQAAPHVAYFTCSFFFAFVGKKFLLPFTSPYIMPVFTLVIPLCNTIILWRKFDTLSEKAKIEKLAHKFGYWVILALYHSLITCLIMIPFSNHIMQYLPYLKELIIVVAIWIQISKVFTDMVLVSVITPVMKYLSVYIPTAQFIDSHHPTRYYPSQQQHLTNQLTNNTIYLLCKNLNILTTSQITFFTSLLKDSVVTLMAFILIFLPYPFSSIGMVMIAWLLPAFRTVSLVQTLRSSRSNNPIIYRGDSQPAINNGNIVREEEIWHWLGYWICVSIVWMIRLYAVTIWPSVMILCTLYLQHSFLQGATYVIALLSSTFQVLVDRNHSTQRMRLQQQQQQQELERLEESISSSGKSGDMKMDDDNSSSKEDQVKKVIVVSRSEEDENVNESIVPTTITNTNTDTDATTNVVADTTLITTTINNNPNPVFVPKSDLFSTNTIASASASATNAEDDDEDYYNIPITHHKDKTL